MNPFTSERNFTPSSTGLASLAEIKAGVAVLLQIVQGHEPPVVAVVKDEVKVAARAFPAKSLTRGSTAPPSTLTVNELDEAKAELGVNVATRVAPS
jgi:hypothetical protein